MKIYTWLTFQALFARESGSQVGYFISNHKNTPPLCERRLESNLLLWVLYIELHFPPTVSFNERVC